MRVCVVLAVGSVIRYSCHNMRFIVSAKSGLCLSACSPKLGSCCGKRVLGKVWADFRLGGGLMGEVKSDSNGIRILTVLLKADVSEPSYT